MRGFGIQLKITLMFFLLILVSMQFIGVYLLRALETYYLEEEQDKRRIEAQLLANDVADALRESMRVPGEDGSQDDSQDVSQDASPGGSRDGSQALPDPSQESLTEGEQQQVIQQILEEFSRGRYVQMLVLDASGNVVAANDRGRLGQRALQDAEVFEVLEEGEVRTFQRFDPVLESRRLGAAAPILSEEGEALGITLVEGDLTVIQETLVAVRDILFSATVIAVLVAVFLAWLLSKTITGPIRAITARAAKMAAGDFQQRIEVRSRDELGRLAAMFNHLAGRLGETLTEISDEKRKVEAILTHMADGVVAFDREGRVALINPAARDMLGRGWTDPPVRFLGRTWQDLWPDLPGSEKVDALLRGEASEGDGPLSIRRGERTLRTHLAPIGGGPQPPAGVVWVLHDVTELESLESVRREFVANVSHELRTPLTTIKSYTETLLDDPSVDQTTARSFLEVIRQETDRMVRLVQDLLDLSRMEFRQTPWEREYCQLSELASLALVKLKAQIDDKGIEARLLRDEDTEPLVYVDPDRFQQVLINLLSNAIEFTPPGGRIEIRVESHRDEVRAEVRDTGMGIPPEDLPRLFDRFYRVDKARSRKLGGTGLGLSIARQIVEGHGGRIGIDSEPGEGTTVWFTVPLEPVSAPE